MQETEKGRCEERWNTCFVGQPEGHHFVRDVADVPDGSDAAVVGVVLRSKILQFQDLRFALQLAEEGALRRARQGFLLEKGTQNKKVDGHKEGSFGGWRKPP